MKQFTKAALVLALAAALMLALCCMASAETIHTTDHEWGPATLVSQATCIKAPVYSHTCTICGRTETFESGVKDATAHQYGDWTVINPPECEADGSQRRVCKLCGDVQDQTIPKTNHDWSGEWKVQTPATCTTEGVEVKVCKNNMHHTVTRTIPATGHSYEGKITTAPTCTTPGVMTYVCKNDSSHTYTEPIAALGHNYVGTITTAPTCTEPGVRTYVCQNDNSHTYTEIVPATGHDYKGTVTTAPTCTEPGVRTYVCSHDSSHTYTEPIPATDHKWNSGVVTKQPTCTEPGTRLLTCQNDSSHTKEETIPATGHQHTHWVITKQPTYTEEGERKLYCDDCGALLKTEKMSVRMFYGNTVCAIGPRLRDVNLSPYNSDNWYMFTPFDASRDGRQTFTLIGSNRYDVGTATIVVRDGTVTFDYNVYPNVDIKLEFFTILNQMSDLHEYEPEALSSLSMVPGRAYSIEDDFNGDTNLVLYFCSRADYSINRYVTSANLGTPYRNLCRSMLSMMDK